MKKGKKLSDYAGIWADMPESEWKAIEKGVKEDEIRGSGDPL